MTMGQKKMLCKCRDVSGFVRLFLILTKYIFLTANVRKIQEKRYIIGEKSRICLPKLQKILFFDKI